MPSVTERRESSGNSIALGNRIVRKMKSRERYESSSTSVNRIQVTVRNAYKRSTE